MSTCPIHSFSIHINLYSPDNPFQCISFVLLFHSIPSHSVPSLYIPLSTFLLFSVYFKLSTSPCHPTSLCQPVLCLSQLFLSPPSSPDSSVIPAKPYIRFQPSLSPYFHSVGSSLSPASNYKSVPRLYQSFFSSPSILPSLPRPVSHSFQSRPARFSFPHAVRLSVPPLRSPRVP